MVKKQNNPKNKPAAKWQPWWLIIAGITAVLLLAGGVFLLLGGAQSVTGTPKAVVEQPIIDEGFQTYNTQVRTAFTIKNEGDGVLRILEQPRVELIEGC